VGFSADCSRPTDRKTPSFVSGAEIYGHLPKGEPGPVERSKKKSLDDGGDSGLRATYQSDQLSVNGGRAVYTQHMIKSSISSVSSTTLPLMA
jgi:hypothetical protein